MSAVTLTPISQASKQRPGETHSPSHTLHVLLHFRWMGQSWGQVAGFQGFRVHV